MQLQTLPKFLTENECDTWCRRIDVALRERECTHQHQHHAPAWLHNDQEATHLLRERVRMWRLPYEVCGDRVTMGRYQVGQHLGMHRDEPLQGGDASLLVYLNGDIEGGNTAFSDPCVHVTPEAGKAIVFDISALHMAEPVVSGVKYILGCELIAAVDEHGVRPL
jgi:hypothetical protein